MNPELKETLIIFFIPVALLCVLIYFSVFSKNKNGQTKGEMDAPKISWGFKKFDFDKPNVCNFGTEDILVTANPSKDIIIDAKSNCQIKCSENKDCIGYNFNSKQKINPQNSFGCNIQTKTGMKKCDNTNISSVAPQWNYYPRGPFGERNNKLAGGVAGDTVTITNSPGGHVLTNIDLEGNGGIEIFKNNPKVEVILGQGGEATNFQGPMMDNNGDWILKFNTSDPSKYRFRFVRFFESGGGHQPLAAETITEVVVKLGAESNIKVDSADTPRRPESAPSLPIHA